MGDVSGWVLGATYVTRSMPRTEDVVESAWCDVVWSDRWGRHVPADWRGECVAVSRRESGARDAVTVVHGTPHNPRKWARVDDPGIRGGAAP